ncbi:MAG: glycosyltransferase [Nitrospiria bacterium]
MTKKKKVLFYCQHVLGMGHLIRSREIVHALKDFEVCFLNGGELIPGFEFSPEIEVVNLPPIKSDASFKEIRSSEGFQSLDEIKAARTKKILAEYARFQPDAIIIELFPFGRRKFAFELIPLLTRIRLDGRHTKVVCSLRDILVSKRDQARHEDQVLNTMNRYFDLLLIHADPQFQRLEETFSRMGDLKTPAKYTGFVAEACSEEAIAPSQKDSDLDDFLNEKQERPLVLASIGGGRVGIELLECAVEASARIEKSVPHRLLIFAGPYLPEADFARLEEMTAGQSHIRLRKYTTQFLSFMRQADLSISMAGYNTCMNLLVTGVKALLLPFTGNQNEEQTIRAKKLEALGLAMMIPSEALNPVLLAEKITTALQASSVPTRLEVNGAAQTAVFLKEMLTADESHPARRTAGGSNGPGSSLKTLEARLCSGLDALARENKAIRMFLRDDDADDDLEMLRSLFDVTLSASVPINLAIIPGTLSDAGIQLLDNHKHLHPDLFGLNQHGWRHLNHEKEGRKCEFGPSRGFDSQFEDISRGKALLEKVFRDKFYPAFTPPWNRCTEDTFKVLHQLGFKVFSKDRGKMPVTGYVFQEISTTLDLYRWKGNPAMKTPEEIVTTLLTQMRTLDPVGLLLHHKVMGADEFSFLDFLLQALRRYPNIRFHTFESLARTGTH